MNKKVITMIFRGYLSGLALALAKPLAWYKRQPRRRRTLMLVALLLLTAGLLAGCDYPGQDPPCVGANKGQDGCNNPATGIKDSNNGGDWYDNWAFDIIRRFLSSVAINVTKFAVNTFWSIFTNLGSTDFASCSSNSNTTGNPVCTTYGVFLEIQQISLVFFALVISYKWAKSYFAGSLVGSLYESAFSFVPRILIAGFFILYLAPLISGAFGMSNVVFETIVGSPKTLNDLSAAIVGTKDCHQDGSTTICSVSGIQGIEAVQDVGQVAIMTIVCLFLSISYIVLGVCFFLRTIIIYILFCCSPAAVLASATDEFKHWFGRWVQSIQSMMVAPIPVAICFALVKSFLGAIPSPHDDPGGFVLQLIYVISFLAIGSLLMFKVAGQVGGALFGAISTGLSAGVGLGVGLTGAGAGAAGRAGRGLLGKLRGSGRGGDEAGAESGEDTIGSSGERPRLSGGRSFESGSGSWSGGAGRAGAAAQSAILEGAVGAGAGTQQAQADLIAAIRAMNANASAAMFAQNAAAVSPTGYNSATLSRGGGSGGGGFHIPFSQSSARQMQNFGQWAARQVEIDAPTFTTFAPPYYRGYERGPAPRSASAGTRAKDPSTTKPEPSPASLESPGEGYGWPTAEGYGDQGQSTRPSEGGGGWPSVTATEPGNGGVGASVRYYGDGNTGTESGQPGYRYSGAVAGSSGTPTTSRPRQPVVTTGKNPVTNPYGDSKPNVPPLANLTGRNAKRLNNPNPNPPSNQPPPAA